MSKTVQRSEDGQITHLLVGREMLPKAEAEKIMYDHIPTSEIQAYIDSQPSPNILTMKLLVDLINEDISITELRTKIVQSQKK